MVDCYNKNSDNVKEIYMYIFLNRVWLFRSEIESDGSRGVSVELLD